MLNKQQSTRVGQVGLEEKAYIAGVWFERAAAGHVLGCGVAMYILAKCGIILVVRMSNLFQVIKHIFVQLEKGNQAKFNAVQQ